MGQKDPPAATENWNRSITISLDNAGAIHCEFIILFLRCVNPTRTKRTWITEIKNKAVNE